MPAKNPPTGTDADLKLATLVTTFSDETKARRFIESKLWPNSAGMSALRKQGRNETDGPPLGSKSPVRPGVYKCKGCREQFTVRIGTIFEESKVPLCKWLMAIHLMTSSKKGISSLHQIARQLGITQKRRLVPGSSHPGSHEARADGRNAERDPSRSMKRKCMVSWGHPPR